jgi:release factor glutamine methyltransferase
VSATIKHLLLQDSSTLKAALNLESGEARSEVQCLLQRSMKVQRAYLLAHPEQALIDEELVDYQSLLRRRMTGEPIAYILGEREFFGLNLKVTPATLIPRPETELLVEQALILIPQKCAMRVLDLGTGSGAIALAIAHSRPEAEVWACDVSDEALAVAGANAQRMGIQNVRFIRSEWYSALAGQRFDLIVSNPPYVAASDPHLKRGDVRFEPLSALVGGFDGLEDIRRITRRASQHLLLAGWILLEHGYDQAESVRELLAENGFIGVSTEIDLAGVERVSCGRCK